MGPELKTGPAPARRIAGGVSPRILVAPASFKGSLSAISVAEAIRRGFLAVVQAAEITAMPVADGGEGTVDALLAAVGGRPRVALATGPLGSEVVPAAWAVLSDGDTAVIEMAAASGLPLVPPERRDPMVTTSAGTGELIREALDAGCSTILIGLGGSATVDAGLGAMRVLGAGFLDAEGRPVPPGGRGLLSLARIDSSKLDPRLGRVRFVVLADVDNPLVGTQGAARVFGPQKGADAPTVELLERGLENFARLSARELTPTRDIRSLPGGGAAGGLGACFAAFFDAEIVSGIGYVMEALGFAGEAARSNLVVTGEGQLDGQSRRGKACAGVAREARRVGCPVVALVGSVREESEALEGLGLDAVLPVVPGPMTLLQAMDGASAYVEAAAARLARLLLLGVRLGAGEPAG